MCQVTRSATIGSTDAARLAGMKQASAATATSTIDTATKVMPSVGSMPNNSVVSAEHAPRFRF